MRTTTPIRLAAAVMLTSLVVAACGQKQGVRVGDEGLAAGAQTGQQQSGVQDTTGTQPADTSTAAPTEGATGATVDPNAGSTTTDTTGGTTGDTGGTTGGTDTSTGGGEATTGGGGGGESTGGGSSGGGGESTGGGNSGGGGESTGGGGGGGGAQVIGNDRTGATDDAITIGLHAPATGAAPLPTTSFNKAKETYWNEVLKDGGNVLGRSKVNVIFKDDKYDPNSAGQVCKELAAESFLVAGGGGTDQIQRCGQLANVGKFPYFSAGVTEAGLADNPWYFAASMTYKQQGSLLAQYVAKDPHGVTAPGADGQDGKVLGSGAKIGTIITDTSNFKDALQGWNDGLAANGLKAIDTFQHTKNDKSWIPGTAQSFKDQGIDVVYFLSAPTLFLDFVNQADSKYNYNPLYIGPGVSKGLNAVLNGGCKAPGKRDDNAVYLSPFPGLDYARENIQEFITASDAQGAPKDDIALALWGSNEAYHKMFQKYAEVYGNDLERNTFRQFVEQQAGTIDSKTYPKVSYSQGATGHFGAGTAHVLQSDCSSKEWTTLAAFASGF